MPDKKVTLHQKIDGEDRTITASERAVHVYEQSGWKRAPKSQQSPKS